MNQKFIISLSVALMFLVPVHAGARSVKADAGVYQNAPTITVKGVVTDTQGEPLPGASVLVKGTSNGTVTDVDGNYAIAAQQGQTVVVSFIGFKDQEFSVAKAQQNVALASESTILDDVIVVGYGSTKKANLTGAVDAVDSKVFENRAFGSTVQMLNEYIPNVEMVVTNGQPYQQQYMSIRGNITNIATINNGGGDGGTLILIDGTEGDLSLVNPSDIESVTVLKDAASAAIYGARGSVGVILVETKNPEKNTDKVTINYTGDFNFSSPLTKPDYLTDGLEYARLAMEAVGYFYADAEGVPGNYSKLTAYKNSVNFKNGMGNDIQGYYNQLKAYREAGGTAPIQADAKGNYLYYGNTDWHDLLYKDHAFSHIHSLSVSGNNGKVSYSVSGRLYDYNGLYNYDADTYKTMNLRAKLSAQILPWLKLTENMDFAYDKIHKPLSTKGTSTYTPEKAVYKFGNPSASMYNPDGTLTQAGAFIFGPMLTGSAYKNSEIKAFKTTTGLKASFFDNTLRFNADYTYRMKNNDARQKVMSVDYSEKVGVIVNNLDDLSEQYMKQNNSFLNQHTVNAYGEYENTFGGKHYLKAMLGYNYVVRTQQNYGVEKAGLLDSTVDSFQRLTADLPSDFYSEYRKYRDAGMFFRLNYTFDERFLLEVNGRYDGSSKFPSSRQYAFFPSVSGGWRVSAEPWWHVSPKFISNLKFRASYGELGDGSSLSAYGYEEKFGEVKDYLGKRVIDGNAGATYLKFPEDFNSSYTWARIRTTNVGADLGLFNGDLNISYDYYIRRSLDMLVGDGNYAPTFGSKSAIGNNADLSTYGWELVVNYNHTFMAGGKPFHIGVRGTLADNHAVVDRYPNETADLNKSGGYYAGMEIGEIWGYRVGGIWNSFDEINNWRYIDAQGVEQHKPYEMATSIKQNNTKNRFLPGQVWFEDLNGDGTITKGKTNADTQDWEVVGNKYPRYNYSIGINLDWNNIFFSATFTGVGRQDWSGASGAMYGLFTKEHNLMPNYLIGKTWTPQNTDAFWPALSYTSAIFNGETNIWNGYVSGVPTDRYTFNVAYIKLKNLQLGYNLPKNIVRKVGLSGVKVYFSGENLWDWSPVYKYIQGFNVATIGAHVDDDDMFNFGSDSVGSQYPILKTYSFGISITY